MPRRNLTPSRPAPALRSRTSTRSTRTRCSRSHRPSAATPMRRPRDAPDLTAAASTSLSTPPRAGARPRFVLRHAHRKRTTTRGDRRTHSESTRRRQRPVTRAAAARCARTNHARLGMRAPLRANTRYPRATAAESLLGDPYVRCGARAVDLGGRNLATSLSLGHARRLRPAPFRVGPNFERGPSSRRGGRLGAHHGCCLGVAAILHPVNRAPLSATSKSGAHSHWVRSQVERRKGVDIAEA
jgi:hypothetical protein